MGNTAMSLAMADDDDAPSVGADQEACMMAFLIAEATEQLRQPHTRAGNKKRNREHALDDVAGWSDRFFYRQFRMRRYDFDKIKESLIAAGFPARDEEMARLSSGSPVRLETRMYVALRMVGGASYLDMHWYGVDVDKVVPLMIEVLEYMNRCAYLDNIHVPLTHEEVAARRAEWRDISRRKHAGEDLIPGTVLAGDGLVIEIPAPSERRRQDVGGLPQADFYNRKGYFALVLQAFCDAHGRFCYFALKWAGSTNDIVAYKQTPLYALLTGDIGPEHPWFDCHVALDEAYGSIGGDHHLSPYTKSQLKKAQKEDNWQEAGSTYHKMLAFNNRLSSQRITIERVFGMYVRRWGILWKELDYSIPHCQLIAEVCAKLHNMNVNALLRERASGVPRNPGDVNDDIDGLTDAEVMARRENDNLDELTAERAALGQRVDRVAESAKRDYIRDEIFRNGFIYSRK